MILIPKSVESTDAMIAEIMKTVGKECKNFECASSNAVPTNQTHPNDIVVELAYSDNLTMDKMADEIKRQTGIENNVTKNDSHRFLVIRKKRLSQDKPNVK